MYQKYVEVEFVYEWMGNPVGSRMKINEIVARNLQKRGTVMIIESEDKKSIDSPPVNKMIESPQNKKGIGRPKK